MKGCFKVGDIVKGKKDNGYGKLDNNIKFLFKNVTTVDDLNRILGDCFIEVVE